MNEFDCGNLFNKYVCMYTYISKHQVVDVKYIVFM